jgi:hypothetical protein
MKSPEESLLIKIINLREEGDAAQSLDLCNSAATQLPHLREWLLDNKARALVDLGNRKAACEIWAELSLSSDKSVSQIASETLSAQLKHIDVDAQIEKAKDSLLNGNTDKAFEALMAVTEQASLYGKNAVEMFCRLHLSSQLHGEFLKAQENKSTSKASIIAKPTSLDRLSALALCLDVQFCEEAFLVDFSPGSLDKKRARVAQFIIDKYEQLEPKKISSLFDLKKYADLYACKPLDSALDLLMDTDWTKRPYPEFDTRFVAEYYSERIIEGSYIHPYLLYVDDPSIYINPREYITGSKNSAGSDKDKQVDYWNFTRANNHLHGIYGIEDDVKFSTHQRDRVIHVLVPAFDVKSISAGFFGVFAVAKLIAKLAKQHLHRCSINLLFVDHFDFYPSLFSYALSKTTGIEDLLNLVSYSFLRPSMAQRYKSEPVVIGPDDLFVASVWYTASIANKLRSLQSSGKKYLYLIQDYEAGFYPRNSHFCLAERTYNKIDYFALVSSLPLYKQLYRQGILPHQSYYFENASASKPMSKDEFIQIHENKPTKKLMIYGRPNVDRNMFELTILSLMLAYRAGVFSEEWQFYSLGLGSTQIELSYNPTGGFTFVQQCPRMTLVEYEKFIQSADICLTLMASPHPSLLPFDFSGNGSLVVTNTFQAKDKDFFLSYSPLIFAEEPDPSILAAALSRAASKVDELEWRYDNKCEKYPRTWDSTWTTEVKDFLKRWMTH